MSVKYQNAIDQEYAVVDESTRPMYGVTTGAKSISYKKVPSAQSQSTTGTEYLIQPNKNQLVSKILYEQHEVNYAFSFTNTTAAAIVPFVENSVTTAFMPLANSSTLTFSLNSQPFKVSYNEMIGMLFSFNKNPDMNGVDLVNSSQLDTFCDMIQAGGANQAKQTGSNQNTFSDYFSNTYGTDGRFGSVTWVLPDNTAIPANSANVVRNISVTYYEPIFCGVTELDNKNASSWININSINISRVNVTNWAQRQIKYTSPNAGLTCTVVGSYVNTPNLFYKLTTLPDYVKLPAITYHQGFTYDMFNKFAKTAPTASGAVETLTSNAINLNIIPRCIYVAVLKATGLDKGLTVNDAPGYQIQTISIDYAGVSQQFGSISTPFEVYKEFCASEGFVKTFTETGYTTFFAGNGLQTMGLYGSVLRIDTRKLNLDWSKYSVGSQFASTLQVTVTAQNLSSAANIPTLCVLPVNDVIYSISDNECNIVSNIVDSAIVEQLRNEKMMVVSESKLIGGKRLMKGRGFWDKVWSGIKDVGEFAWDNKDKIGNVALKMAGLGKKKKMKGHGLYEPDSETEDSEPEQYGGSRLTKSEMRHKLKFL